MTDAELAAHYKRQRDNLLASMQESPVSSGVCCCGDAMDAHAHPMDCGHSPRDEWDWHVECTVKQIKQEDAAIGV